jgi:hypothetical protein
VSVASLAPRVVAASGRAEPRWYLGGVAAAVSARTRIPAGLLRFLIFCVAAKHFWPALAIYGAAALVVPHQGRWHPGWLNVVGAARVAILGGALALVPVFLFNDHGIFGQGPGLWIPVDGVVAAAVLALVTEPRVDPLDHEPADDRRTALSMLPALAVAALTGLGMLVAPGLRAELLLGAGLVLAGVAVAALGEQINLRAAVVPLMLLGVLAILLASSGARLQGGVGDLRAAPRSAAAVAPVYRRAIGEVTLDLRQVTATPGGPVRVRVSVGLGGVHILLPRNATGSFEARIGEGDLNPPADAPTGGAFVHSLVALRPEGPPLRGPGARFDITVALGRGCLVPSVPGEVASC